MRALKLQLAIILVSLPLGFVPRDARGEEVFLPEFDLDGVRASYLLALPPGHDPEKPLPLIVDFHGAIRPDRRGGDLTYRYVWSKFVQRVPCIVASPNGRKRSWGQPKVGEPSDNLEYFRAVLADVQSRVAVDPARIYLAGFSSGSDFLCTSGVQLEADVAASMPICPGPPSVVGVSRGEILEVKDYPFFFVTGEEDWIRKPGPWAAYRLLDENGAKNIHYRELPGVDHSFAGLDEYVRLFETLEALAGTRDVDPLTEAMHAYAEGDYLRASTLALELDTAEASLLLGDVRAEGLRMVEEAIGVNARREPGRAHEAWWRVQTQMYRFPDLRGIAEEHLENDFEFISYRDLGRSKRAHFLWRQLGKFDRYLSFRSVTRTLDALATRYPDKAKLVSMGESVEGRQLLCLAITDPTTGTHREKPAAFLMGGLHGNEASSVMVSLYMAWQLAANPDRKRSIRRLLEDATIYVAPAVNPDAFSHHMREPHSHWRPRFNYRPYDADGDGRIDEDGYEDLNGDGEISLMYRPAPNGDFVLKNGRMARGEGEPRYKAVGREGTDDDGDGLFSEDPPGGVDLNRNFPVGWRARKSFEGFRGAEAGSEPETKALMDFISARPAISLFLDIHNDASCLFTWRGADCPEEDVRIFDGMEKRAEDRLGYVPRPLEHGGAGLAVAWAYGARGIPAAILELSPAPIGVDRNEHLATAWGDDAWIPPTPFQHPQLGEILLGNDTTKLAKRNPHPRDLQALADEVWTWVRGELRLLPKLEFRDVRVLPYKDGAFRVVGNVLNDGGMPTDTAMAKRLGLAAPIELAAEGATLEGVAELPGSLAAGESRAFDVVLRSPGENVTLVVSHPRGGTLRQPVLRPRSASIVARESYEIPEGFVTADAAIRANNDHYTDGVAAEERGPRFVPPEEREELRVAVLLGEWADRRHTFSADAFREALFSVGTYTDRSRTGQHVYGSLRDHYRAMSYGKLDVTGKVFDWVELPGSWEAMRDASFGSPVVQDTMMKKVREVHGDEALDGFDLIACVWAGSSVSRVTALWPMRLTFRDQPELRGLKTAEFHAGELTPIGVFCHELGHTFGVLDKYGLGATPNPMGPWCLMAKGTHGAAPSGRHRPFDFCAWCKTCIGWVEPTVIDPDVPQALALRPITSGPREAIRVLLEPDGSRYLLLTNRRREGHFTDLPSEGLVVLEVGPNDRPQYPQTRVQLHPAHGQPPRGRGLIAHPEEVAWPQEGRDELMVDGVWIRNIRRHEDGVVTFRVERLR